MVRPDCTMMSDLTSRVEMTGVKLPVTAYGSDGGKELATGTLYAINNQMTTSTGTVTLRASFANDDETLFPNEFVNVRLLVDTLHQAVLVPTAAVLSGAPGNYVYLVNKDDTVSVHYHCSACWNDLPEGVEPEFKACPLCGHGMFLVDPEDSPNGR